MIAARHDLVPSTWMNHDHTMSTCVKEARITSLLLRILVRMSFTVFGGASKSNMKYLKRITK